MCWATSTSISAWLRTRTPSFRKSTSPSASALRTSSANAMLTLSAIVVGFPHRWFWRSRWEPHGGRHCQQATAGLLHTLVECDQTKPHPSRRCNSFPCQGPASQQESSLTLCEVTTTTERRQSDRQARTEVKRFSLVRCMKQRPTVFQNGKATVGVGYGNCAGDAAGSKSRACRETDGWRNWRSPLRSHCGE